MPLPACEIQAMTSLRNSLLSLFVGQNLPGRFFFFFYQKMAKNEVGEMLIAEGEGKTGKVKEQEMKNPEQGWKFEYVTKDLMDCFWVQLSV